MNESLVKYLAGLLDADGSLSFIFKHDQNREGRYFVGVKLGLTAADAVDKMGWLHTLPDQTGFGTVSRYGDKKQFSVWSVAKRADLEMLLPRLVKHMVVKARHWQWILDTWRNMRVDRRTCSFDEREVLTAASKESRRLNCGPLKAKNFPTWAWLAGYLDGDGCYTHSRHLAKTTGYYQWRMDMSASAHVNDRCVLDFLCRTIGGSVRPQGQSPNVLLWRRSLGYQHRSFALSFLPNMAKHSRLKRKKIDAMIHHHRQRLSVPGTDKTFCEVDNCGLPSIGHRMCSKHYQRHKAALKVQATV